MAGVTSVPRDHFALDRWHCWTRLPTGGSETPLISAAIATLPSGFLFEALLLSCHSVDTACWYTLCGGSVGSGEDKWVKEMCRGHTNPHEYYMWHSFHTSADDIDRAAYSQIPALWGGFTFRIRLLLLQKISPPCSPCYYFPC